MVLVHQQIENKYLIHNYMEKNLPLINTCNATKNEVDDK
jgi:hypothetical protein